MPPGENFLNIAMLHTHPTLDSPSWKFCKHSLILHNYYPGQQKIFHHKCKCQNKQNCDRDEIEIDIDIPFSLYRKRYQLSMHCTSEFTENSIAIDTFKSPWEYVIFVLLLSNILKIDFDDDCQLHIWREKEEGS